MAKGWLERQYDAYVERMRGQGRGAMVTSGAVVSWLETTVTLTVAGWMPAPLMVRVTCPAGARSS